MPDPARIAPLQRRNERHGEHHRRNGEGSARKDRRGHDGLQGRRSPRRNGDIEAAIDWLRKKGLSKAAKKAGRVAAEGLVAIAVNGNEGVVVEVNSETDFVARNDEFQGLVKTSPGRARGKGEADREDQGGANRRGHRRDAIANAIATIGENMTLRRAAIAVGRQGRRRGLCPRRRGRRTRQDRRAGCAQSAGKTDELSALGRQIAMHIAATNPLALDPAGLDSEIVRREKDVLADKYRQQGKPENMIEKIVESGLKTYYKEVCLLEQAFIHDTAKSVAQAIKEAEGKVGAPVKLTGFVRYALGEGIEKAESDFAAEVAAAAGTA
jgi:elongation factor Ts